MKPSLNDNTSIRAIFPRDEFSTSNSQECISSGETKKHNNTSKTQNLMYLTKYHIYIQQLLSSLVDFQIKDASMDYSNDKL